MSLQYFTFSIFDGARDNQVQQCCLSFTEFVEYLEAEASQPRSRLDKEATGCFIPASFTSPFRSKANIDRRHAFALDVDGDRPGNLSFEEMGALLESMGIPYVIHTTTKSTKAVNRYRVILPCEPLTVEEYEEACSSLDQAFSGGLGIFDTKTFDASRLNFYPQAWYGLPKDVPDFPVDDAFDGFQYRLTGDLIPVRDIVAAFPPLPKEDAVEAVDVSAYLASRPLTSVHDISQLTDLHASPLVTEEMRTDYLMSPVGGRYYAFLCRAAMRALYKGLPCEVSIIHALGIQMNQLGSHTKRRTEREAARAIAWAVANHHPDTNPTMNEVYGAITRLKNKKKKGKK